ncbi:MAG: type II toxin-antitoxin system YoeB family toxin [Cycloclasticus sp.]|nr:type II toxin-antitoxin system YoeB family toxin [Cycloclasticus sp.]
MKEMLRGDPSTGTGKPEPLKQNLSGLCSRRMSQKDK